MSLFAQVRAYIDSLVHPVARLDPLTAARHRAFIATRLIGGLILLTALPLHLALRGVPDVLEAIAYAWLVAPILIACFLSRTGRYAHAQILSSVALTGLIVAIAAATGGVASFAAVWLVVVPLEAALSASRRVTGIAAAVALAAAAMLFALGEMHVLPANHASSALALLGVASAAAVATGLALNVASLASKSSDLLGAEEDRYRLLARNMTDVITRHARNGVVRFASPAAEAVFGVPARALMGHGLFDRVHVADRPAYLTALTDAAARGESRSVEFRIRRGPAGRDGAPHFLWVEMRCRPLDHTGAAGDRELVAVIRDVTERKEQAEAVEAARTEAERANAAKSKFLATMSHELRTPLNAIIGFSDMLANEELMNLDAARRRDYALLISKSGHHLLSVVNGILDMSRIETGNFEITPDPFAPMAAIGACCDMMTLKAREAGVDLVCRPAAALPEIVADQRAVKQILINLLSNAIKFTPRGGRVAVHADVDGAFLAFAVEDSGVGIGEADLAHVGDPFFQVRGTYDRPHDGTGLGLSIVKGLVDLHGGTLEVKSRVGSGTRVTFRLPIEGRPARLEHGPPVERLPRLESVAEYGDARVKRRA